MDTTTESSTKVTTESSTKITTDGKTSPTSPKPKYKKKKSIPKRKKRLNSKKKLHSRSKSKKKKSTKSKKHKCNAKKPSKILTKHADELIIIDHTLDEPLNEHINDENKANNNENINILPTTYTSPIHSFNTMAQETSNVDLEKIINDKNKNNNNNDKNKNNNNNDKNKNNSNDKNNNNDKNKHNNNDKNKNNNDNASKSPLEAIKQHKLMKIKQQKNKMISDKKDKICKKIKKEIENKKEEICKKMKKEIENKKEEKHQDIHDEASINLSYFQNYFVRNSKIPNEMNILLDRIENNLMVIFNDTFLNTSIRTKKIYNLCVSLHRSFIDYKLSFLLPVCKIKLIELDTMFLQMIKWFNRFKRYHRSPEILKYKSQINKLKNNVDILINNIESNCSIIIYSTIRAKQLFYEFHKNSKLLIFWMDLFPANEFEFVELSWVDFVNNIRQNKSFKKFKKFKSKDMINILTENYEVLTIQEFLKYVLEYESVGGWLNDMYSYIASEIENPHKKKTKHTIDNISLLDLTDTIEKMIKTTIETEMKQKFIELSSKFGNIEESLSIIKSNQEHNVLDGDEIATFEPLTSNGTVIMHHTSQTSLFSDDSSDDSSLFSDEEAESKNDSSNVIRNLEEENNLLKSEIAQYKEKMKDYELRLNGVTMKSKQVFSLQTKVNYYEKLATLMKKRCYSLHKQLNQDFTQLTMWYNTVHLRNDSDETQQNKLLRIQRLFNNYLTENDMNDNDEINEIQTLFKDILESNGKNVKFNKKSDVMWQRMRNSLQHGTSEILSIHQQLNDNFITNDNMSSTSFSPVSALPQLNNRPQSAKLLTTKALHKRQKTYSVATLKEMHNQMNGAANISKSILTRTRTYSAHDLAQLKFVPLINDNSFDIYTNKPPQKKRVSFAPKPVGLLSGLEPIKIGNINGINKIKKRNSPISPLILLGNSPFNIVNKGTLRKRRNSEGNLGEIKNLNNNNKTVHPIHKLFENESKLNDDTINKIRNELLKENNINKYFKRRHSLCSVNIKANEERKNNEYDEKTNDLLIEKPINYNNFTTRCRATSAGNKAAPLMGLYGDQEFSDDDLIKMRQTHFRNHSTYNKATSRIKKRKHKRYKTASINPVLLSPTWAANIALSTVTDDVYDNANDDSASDVLSTLSNIDYTYMLDEHDENIFGSDDNNNNEHKEYVNIYGDQSPNNLPLHSRRRSYRFPNENKNNNNNKMNGNRISSIIDPFDLLDDKILLELQKEHEELKEYEFEMKTKLITMLREMDLMGEGRLDLADFASGIMNIVNDYDDIMEDAELLFETLQNEQDDMGSIKIEIIVDNIITNKNNDGAANNIKQQIMIGLKIDENEETDNNNDKQNDKSENQNYEMPALYVPPKVIDPNEQPYKPIYQTTNGIQKIGK